MNAICMKCTLGSRQLALQRLHHLACSTRPCTSGRAAPLLRSRALLLLALLCCHPALAEVVTDGSVGAVRSLSGDMIIGEGLGSRAGTNLFHSFRLFNIQTGESATFTGSADIANVISRVTGGTPSNINGLLRSEVGQANFFLINPSGVLFGPRASIDVPAAFHASTADRVNFPDGYYSATDTAGSTLSVAAPRSFGFLARQPAADIRIQGSDLRVKPEQTLSLVGGNVRATIDWSSFSLTRLSSSGGVVRVVAVGTPGAAERVAIADGSSDLAPAGRIDIEWLSRIDVGGSAGAQSILLRGAEVNLSFFSELFADHKGATDSPGSIRIAADSLTISDSSISATSSGAGTGNAIELAATDTLTIQDAKVSADTNGDASGTATLRLSAADLRIVDSDVRALVSGAGQGADIEVAAERLSIDVETASDGFSRLRTRILKGATGTAGDIRVRADEIALTDGGQISSIVDDGGRGGGGSLELEVSKSFVADGWNANAGYSVYSGLMTTMLSTEGRAGGDIRIDAPNASLTLADGALIQAGTAGDGDSGAVCIDAGSLELGRETWVLSSTQGSGAAGDLTIKVTGSALLGDGVLIDSASWTPDAGSAGALSLEVDGDLRMSGARIDTSSVGDRAAGDLSLDVGGGLDITDGRLITRTEGVGAAGDMRLHVGGGVDLRGGSWIDASTLGAGAAGQITLQAGGPIGLSEDSEISAFTFGTGRAGDISLSAGGDVTLSDSSLSARSFSAVGDARIGDAGRIAIDAEALTLRDSSIGVTSSSRANAGRIEVTTRGDILVTTSDGQASGFMAGNTTGWPQDFDPTRAAVEGRSGTVVLQGANIQFSTGATLDVGTSHGDGGRVDIKAQNLSLIDGGLIRATTTGPGQGAAVDIKVSGTLEIAGEDPFDKTSAGITGGTLESSFDPTSGDGPIGPAGPIQIAAERLIIGRDGEINSGSFSTAAGGDIRLDLGTLALHDGGEIFSNAFGAGDAGDILINARDQVSIQGIDPSSSSPSAISASASSFAGRPGQGGDIRIAAPRIELAQGGRIATTGGAGAAGRVVLDAQQVVLSSGGEIITDTSGSGAAGAIDIDATGLRIDGSGSQDLPVAWRQTGISSRARLGSGNAGDIRLAVTDRLDILAGGRVSTSTTSAGDAGRIGIETGQLLIDASTLSSRAEPAASGLAGDIRIDTGTLDLQDGGRISTAALQTLPVARLASAATGGIRIAATQLRLGTGTEIGAESAGNAPGGTIEITGQRLDATDGALIRTDASASGAAGSVRLRVAAIRLDDARIEAGTQSTGAGGAIELIGRSLEAQRGARIQTSTLGSGPAGRIDIRLDGDLRLDAADIAATTAGTGAGGAISIDAGNLSAERQAGVRSSTSAAGSAGTLDLEIDGVLALRSGAELSTATSAAGDAGRIGIRAGVLRIDQAAVLSRAEQTASGLAGDIAIDAGLLELGNQASISTAALAPNASHSGATRSSIDIRAEQLRLRGASAITAESTGKTPAGAITIDADDIEITGLSGITTESVNADGGPIAITAERLLLQDSRITTSVLGAGGDGGDISIRTAVLAMDGGFIQANTAAPGAAGGDILILAEQTLFSRGYVQIGGSERLAFRPGLGLNVIQAAAPDGVAGNISTSFPRLDVTKDLGELPTPVGDAAALASDRCGLDRPLAGSSLLALPLLEQTADAAAAVSFAGARLDRLLAGRP